MKLSNHQQPTTHTIEKLCSCSLKYQPWHHLPMLQRTPAALPPPSVGIAFSRTIRLRAITDFYNLFRCRHLLRQEDWAFRTATLKISFIVLSTWMRVRLPHPHEARIKPVYVEIASNIPTQFFPWRWRLPMKWRLTFNSWTPTGPYLLDRREGKRNDENFCHWKDPDTIFALKQREKSPLPRATTIKRNETSHCARSFSHSKGYAFPPRLCTLHTELCPERMCY